MQCPCCPCTPAEHWAPHPTPPRAPTDLPADSRVFYRVGWPALGDWSAVFNFTTLKPQSNFPFAIGVMADLGLSFNSSVTVRGLHRGGVQRTQIAQGGVAQHTHTSGQVPSPF